MGLDLVEFAMDVEKEFHFQFPDEDMAQITTPGRLIDYLVAHLPTESDYVCRSQRIFYRLRAAVGRHLGCPAASLRPDTSLLDLIPASKRSELWEQVRHDVGCAESTYWPRLAEPGWLDLFRSGRVATFRQATQQIVARLPGPRKIVKGHRNGWTREEVAEVIHRLIHENLGVRRHEYTEESRWTEDMGIY